MRPVWVTATELMAVLARMREWYALGMTDVEISALIRKTWVEPREAFYAEQRRERSRWKKQALTRP